MSSPALFPLQNKINIPRWFIPQYIQNQNNLEKTINDSKIMTLQYEGLGN